MVIAARLIGAVAALMLYSVVGAPLEFWSTDNGWIRGLFLYSLLFACLTAGAVVGEHVLRLLSRVVVKRK